MRANSLCVDFSPERERTEADRLPVAIAALVIFGLSLLSWVAIIGPVFACIHR